MPKHPCVGCVYFKECGNTSRTEPCRGRMTKRQQKEQEVRGCERSEFCPYKNECLHVKGIHTDIWGEGISCKWNEEEDTDYDDYLPFN